MPPIIRNARRELALAIAARFFSISGGRTLILNCWKPFTGKNAYIVPPSCSNSERHRPDRIYRR